VAALFDTGRLAAQVAQVVQLGPAHLAAAHHLDLVEGGRQQREDPLDADAAGDLPDGEGLARAAAPAGDHHALEDLDALLLSLFHPHVDADRVSWREFGLLTPDIDS